MTHTCPNCGAAMTGPGKLEKHKPPAAERLSLIFVGRQLYAIDGIPGLFMLSKHKYSENESLPCVAARGPGGESLFVHATDAEERIKTAMGLSTKESIQ